jgi:pimeloyl-ACP methyl ester carboxylesterase
MVALIHGWEDDHSLWTPMIDPLIEAGYSVVTLDLPGHGYSSASLGALPQAAKLVAAAIAAHGSASATIAHSFGCPVSVLAVAEHGLTPQRMVLIAAACAQREQIARIAARHGLTETQEAAVVDAFERKLGRPVADMDLARIAPSMSAPALIMHDEENDACPIEGALETARVWLRARTYITQGLGHRLIAQNRATIERVLMFLEVA